MNKSAFSIAAWIVVAIAFCASRGDLIELTNGKTLSGSLTGRAAQYVSLTVTENESVIEHRVRPEEIVHIDFLDTSEINEALARYEAEDFSQASRLLEPLCRARLPYLDLLADSDEALFIRLLEAYIKIGRSADSLERAKLWRLKMRSPDQVLRLEELQIIAALTLERYEEAAYYARAWIESDRSAQESAVAWLALAEQELSTGMFENALWIALNPIVFSPPHRPRYIEALYEVAVFAAFELGQTNYSKRLLEDMRTRSLNWPIHSKRAQVLAQLEQLDELRIDSDSSPPRHEPTLRNLNLESLFHVVGTP